MQFSPHVTVFCTFIGSLFLFSFLINMSLMQFGLFILNVLLYGDSSDLFLIVVLVIALICSELKDMLISSLKSGNVIHVLL